MSKWLVRTVHRHIEICHFILMDSHAQVPNRTVACFPCMFGHSAYCTKCTSQAVRMRFLWFRAFVLTHTSVTWCYIYTGLPVRFSNTCRLARRGSSAWDVRKFFLLLRFLLYGGSRRPTSNTVYAFERFCSVNKSLLQGSRAAFTFAALHSF